MVLRESMLMSQFDVFGSFVVHCAHSIFRYADAPIIKRRTVSTAGPTIRSLAIAVGLLLGTSLVSLAALETVIDNGPSSNRVDIFFLGDGYTAADLAAGTYADHVQGYLDHMFSDTVTTDPYYRYRNFFNAFQVNVESNESGADVPQQGITKDTALDATYRADGVTDRLLYIDDFKANNVLRPVLAASGKKDDMRFVTVNSAIYGGGGGGYAVYAGANSNAHDVALHEAGHSFNRLADEYGGSANYTGSEPFEVNVTADDTGAKWSRWLGYNDPTGSVVGAYEGARYFDRGLYRPTRDSKMRSLNKPFNAISREKIILDIYDLVDPLDFFTSNATTLIDPSWLNVTTVDDNVFETQWFVDGFYKPAFDGWTSLDLDTLDLAQGDYTIQLRAYDPTGFDPLDGWVRMDTEKLEQFVDWNISITAVPEPSSCLLATIGFIVFGWQRRRFGSVEH